MHIEDILFNPDIGLNIKTAVLNMVDSYSLGSMDKVLTPTDTNDDVNGSQHAANGGTDFTYRDADSDDVSNATSLGVYDYFSNYIRGYTGHYYNGDGNYFRALVVDPPAYAREEYV